MAIDFADHMSYVSRHRMSTFYTRDTIWRAVLALMVIAIPACRPIAGLRVPVSCIVVEEQSEGITRRCAINQAGKVTWQREHENDMGSTLEASSTVDRSLVQQMWKDASNLSSSNVRTKEAKKYGSTKRQLVIWYERNRRRPLKIPWPEDSSQNLMEDPSHNSLVRLIRILKSEGLVPWNKVRISPQEEERTKIGIRPQ